MTSFSACAASKRLRALWVLTMLCAAVAGCGGGGDSGESPNGGNPPAPPPPPPPASTSNWLSTSPNFELYGTSDSGIDGALRVVNAGDASNTLALSPNPVDSTVVRITGGDVDSTQTSLAAPRVSHLVWDQAGANGSVTLKRMPLVTTGGAKPQAAQISSETAMCVSNGVRFEVIGQSLNGEDAVITYNAPNAQGSCASGLRPRLVTLTMDERTVPLALPEDEALRLQPVAPIHGSQGQVIAFLAWQGSRFVRTDSRLGNVTALPASSVGGTVDDNSRPLGPGFVTRFGIFIRSADGLRRYDKSTDRLSAPLVVGRVAQGTALDVIADDRALYVSNLLADGAIDLYRIEDLLVPKVELLNTEGSLRPAGFRVLRDHVLYALAGRSDWTAWSKQSAPRSAVLAGHNIVLASTAHNTVFTKSLNAQNQVELAQSAHDGSQRRALPDTTLMGGGLADSIAPYARLARANAPFSHALAVSKTTAAPMGEVRWLGFADTTAAISVGPLPSNLPTEAAWQSAGVLGQQALLGLKKTGSADHELFSFGRTSGSLVRVPSN